MQYLTLEEKNRAMRLYREAFPEDSEAFITYYAREVLPRNAVLAQMEGKQVVSMIHLNPYRMRVFAHTFETAYLVAIATSMQKRRMGYMRRLMGQVLLDLQKQNVPFCYLQPANPDYYTPFGFAYVSRYEKRILPDDCTMQELGDWKQNEHLFAKGYPLVKITQHVKALSDQQKEQITLFLQNYMKENYDVYCLRDAAYMHRFFEELMSENGAVTLVYDKQDGTDKLIGVICEWGNEKREERCRYILPQYCKTCKSEKPYMMARIANLKACLCMLKLQDTSNKQSLTIYLSVTDEVLSENTGLFKWRLTKETSELCRQSECDINQIVPQNCVALSIAQLTGFVFGYYIPERLKEIANDITLLSAVLLDEVV